MSVIEGSTPVRPPPLPGEARVRQSSRDLEGDFMEQIFEARCETMPGNSLGEALCLQLRVAPGGGAEPAAADLAPPPIAAPEEPR